MNIGSDPSSSVLWSRTEQIEAFGHGSLKKLCELTEAPATDPKPRGLVLRLWPGAACVAPPSMRVPVRWSRLARHLLARHCRQRHRVHTLTERQ